MERHRQLAPKVADYTKPLPKPEVKREIPILWIVIPLFVIADIITFNQLSAWTQEALDAGENAVRSIDRNTYPALQGFARALQMGAICVVVLVCEGLAVILLLRRGL